MNKKKLLNKGLLGVINNAFPERQIYLRSNGVVKFISLSKPLQVFFTVILVLISSWVGITSYKFLTQDVLLENQKKSIHNLTTINAQINTEIEALKTEVINRTEKLEERLHYLQELIGLDPENSIELNIKKSLNIEPYNIEGTKDSEYSNEVKTDINNLKNTKLIPEISNQYANTLPPLAFKSTFTNRLATVTKNQSKLAINLLKIFKNKFVSLDQKLSPTGFSTGDLLLKWDKPQSVISAGGPYIQDLSLTPLFNIQTNNLGEYPEEFLVLASRLNRNWINLHKTQDILESIPVTIPALEYYVSSQFGRRTDPIKKTPALHPGIDLSGWPGEIIMSAAGGKVIKAGTWGHYGNMVEIDHGNGFRSRYGHMRKLLVRKGQIIGRGQKIGEMGCSGRCTGTHLHFEVWFGEQLQDPLPYIKVSHDVLKIERLPNEPFSYIE
ncbi:MAG: M23 family metallopeptidase [Sphingomonadales bacterium]